MPENDSRPLDVLQLRDLRKDLAAEDGVMLYAVFTDEQLAQAAASHPRSKADLLKIGGIGEERKTRGFAR